MSCSLGPTGLTRAPAQSRHPANIRGINELAIRLDATHCSLSGSEVGGPPAPADLSPASLPGPATAARGLPGQRWRSPRLAVASLPGGPPPRELDEKSTSGRALGREAPDEA